MYMTEIILDVIRAALVKGGQHIMIAPDGGVSIWPDECANLTHCKNCKKWEKDQPALDELTDTHRCGLHLIFTKPYDYCSYAEEIDDES